MCRWWHETAAKGASLGDRLDALWLAWVKANPEVIPKLGMDANNAGWH